MAALDEQLDNLFHDLDHAEDAVGEAPGPLEDPAKATVESDLIDAVAHIETILNLIASAGSPDESNLPGSLPAIADECVALAHEAHKESLKSAPNRVLIGSCVKTIQWMLDVERGYRELAGIQVPVDE